VINKEQIAGVILAGGKASRMGYCDKPLLPLAGKPMIEHVIERATPEVNELLISVNRNPEHYSYLALPLIADFDKAFAGPLVGICSAMLWLDANRTRNQYSHLACFAGDVPCFPTGIVNTLATALDTSNAVLALSQNNGQIQPLFSLWSLSTLHVIVTAIDEGLYGPKLVLPRIAHITVDFSRGSAGDFANINNASDWRNQEKLLNLK